MNQQLQNAYREGRRILQDTAADGFKPLEGFNEKAGKIINDLYLLRFAGGVAFLENLGLQDIYKAE